MAVNPVWDAICSNDSCMMLFVPDNDPICAKALKVVGVAFFKVFIYLLQLKFTHDCFFDGTLQTLDFVKLFDVGS